DDRSEGGQPGRHRFGSSSEAGQLAPDGPEVTRAGQARRARRDRVEPQNLVVLTELPQHVRATRGVHRPILRETNDVFRLHSLWGHGRPTPSFGPESRARLAAIFTRWGRDSEGREFSSSVGTLQVNDSEAARRGAQMLPFRLPKACVY